jgi:ADP-ribose pyrophosphatase YjhB (NUDIX family)
MPVVNQSANDLIAQPALTRDFTVATFVVMADRILLLWHRKLQMWLPPGGHIEPNELPDDAAVREVAEEAGIEVTLVGERGVAVDQPRQLVRPSGIQLESIYPGHEHIDLIYVAVPVDPARSEVVRNEESEAIGWFTRAELVERGVTAEVLGWVDHAFAAFNSEAS